MLEMFAKIKIKTGEIGYIVDVSETHQTYLVEFPKFDIREIVPDDIIEVLAD